MSTANDPQRVFVSMFREPAASLESESEALPRVFALLDEVLRRSAESPRLQFLMGQTHRLSEYVRRFPGQRVALRKLAAAGRLEVGPGMYVVPDMNLLSGECLFLQAKYGKQWVRDVLGVEPRVCRIGEGSGHPPQLPQILRQCGYEYYAFRRAMHRDRVGTPDFWWQGLDGTGIKAHWLSDAQPRAVATVAELAGTELSPHEGRPFGDLLDEVQWDERPTYTGEFNSVLQGTFAGNIHLKKANRRLAARVGALEAFLVVGAHQRWDVSDLWKLVLKHQAHAVIGGAVADVAVKELLDEIQLTDASIDGVWQELERGLDARRATVAVFNPVSFARTEVIDYGGSRMRVTLPPLGFVDVEAARPMAPTAAIDLPVSFESPFYTATVGLEGFVTRLVETASGRELVRPDPALFGGLALQIDQGDPWLNFEGPFDGNAAESALDQNASDPYSRAGSGGVVFRATVAPQEMRARVVRSSPDELLVEQSGVLRVWRLAVNFTTRIHFVSHSPRIAYETTLHPAGRHYRIRVAFPTAIGRPRDGRGEGVIRHEVQFGVRARDSGEHAAQNWVDYSDPAGGLALLNAGTPGSNVDDGILMLTLFRAVAMDHKAESALSHSEGATRVLRYALVPHGPVGSPAPLHGVIREGLAFNHPPVICRVDSSVIGAGGWELDAAGVIVSALRYSGPRVFVRVYEGTGEATTATLSVPANFTTVVDADGLERPTGLPKRCDGKLTVTLRPFEIRGFLFAGEA